MQKPKPNNPLDNLSDKLKWKDEYLGKKIIGSRGTEITFLEVGIKFKYRNINTCQIDGVIEETARIDYIQYFNDHFYYQMTNSSIYEFRFRTLLPIIIERTAMIWCGKWYYGTESFTFDGKDNNSVFELTAYILNAMDIKDRK